jgi:hypothetical protein
MLQKMKRNPPQSRGQQAADYATFALAMMEPDVISRLRVAAGRRA